MANPLEEHITAALSRFDEKFKDPEWLRGKLNDDSLPLASRRDIKDWAATELRAMRERTIEEVRRVVPEERNHKHDDECENDQSLCVAIQGDCLTYNSALHATLTALSALKGDIKT